ncbi:hypothetical protein T4A_13603 [Trichinella pseudospiralis]|uniref:Uncharacterized protein n=1 Tax=Trichinella pseudospiralis TaxID=6337 RepID=A0A0V1BCW6_TRIPS|nr:hypothetical protein T4A_13603 [Trichinella pseudospiralis]
MTPQKPEGDITTQIPILPTEITAMVTDDAKTSK